MSETRVFWLRVTVATTTALALLCALSPASPPDRAAWPLATAFGLCAGAALFTAVTRSPPRLPRGTPTPVLVGRVMFFGLWATNEEVLWRRLALGALLSVGVAPALAASTAGFALAHRTRRLVHLGTGGVFAVLYVGTGVLAASVAAHWLYNVLVSALVDSSRSDTRVGA